MPRQVDSPTTKLLRLADELSPAQLLDAIDILRHKYGQTRPRGTAAPTRQTRRRKVSTASSTPEHPE